MEDGTREQQQRGDTDMVLTSLVMESLETMTSGNLKRFEDWINDCRAEGCPGLRQGGNV